MTYGKLKHISPQVCRLICMCAKLKKKQFVQMITGPTIIGGRVLSKLPKTG